MRFAGRACLVATLTVLLATLAIPVYADVQDPRLSEPSPNGIPAVPDLPAPTLQRVDLLEAPPAPVAAPTRRPAALLPLYSSFAALQGLDFYTTRRALDNGAREANPFMRDAATRDSTMIAMKAAGSVVAIWATEKLWKNKRGRLAVFSAVLLNVASGYVVMHNYRIAP